jgi:hypothetical protein
MIVAAGLYRDFSIDPRTICMCGEAELRGDLGREIFERKPEPHGRPATVPLTLVVVVEPHFPHRGGRGLSFPVSIEHHRGPCSGRRRGDHRGEVFRVRHGVAVVLNDHVPGLEARAICRCIPTRRFNSSSKCSMTMIWRRTAARRFRVT